MTTFGELTFSKVTLTFGELKFGEMAFGDLPFGKITFGDLTSVSRQDTKYSVPIKYCSILHYLNIVPVV